MMPVLLMTSAFFCVYFPLFSRLNIQLTESVNGPLQVLLFWLLFWAAVANKRGEVKTAAF